MLTSISKQEDTSIFIRKYYEFIDEIPATVLGILDELERQGGAHKVLNSMDKYIQFHPKIRERFQNALEKSPEQLNQFYKQKFLNKMLYHFKLKFGNNNEILKEVLQNVFDKSIVNY